MRTCSLLLLLLGVRQTALQGTVKGRCELFQQGRELVGVGWQGLLPLDVKVGEDAVHVEARPLPGWRGSEDAYRGHVINRSAQEARVAKISSSYGLGHIIIQRYNPVCGN